MKITSKIIACILITLFFSACSTQNNVSDSLLLQSAYEDRGIHINQQGQLEPELLSEFDITGYYWEPQDTFDRDTINARYSIHYAGILLNIIENKNELFVVTPHSLTKKNTDILTELPLLNQSLALSIQKNTQFILNISQLSNEKSLILLMDIIKESNNNSNIKVIYSGGQKRVLKTLLPVTVGLISDFPAHFKTTPLDLLSLCQSLNDDAVSGSYVSYQDRLQLLKKGDISYPELIQVLPHDADFFNLSQQQNLWRNGQYHTFNGKVANISKTKPKYTAKKTTLSAKKRDEKLIDKPEPLTINLN